MGSNRLHIAYRAVLLAFGLLVMGLLFRQLVTLLIAVLITVLIAIAISAAASRLERLHVPRPLGALFGLLVGLGFLAGALLLVIPSLIDETSTFVDQVPSIVGSLEEKIRDVTGAQPGAVGDRVQEFLQSFGQEPGKLIGPLASLGLNIAGILGGFVLILLTAYYMAANPRPLVDGMLSLLPPDRRGWAGGIVERVRTAWIGWMQGVLIDMLVTGVLLYVGLSLIGLDFALVFAVLSALLVLVPYFGAIAAGIPPVLFALADSPGKAALALGVYLLVQQIESNVTIPLVMAQRVDLHPAVVAIGVVLVGQVFGLLGLFVAVPILALVTIGVDELWVKQVEDRRGVRAATEQDVHAEAAELLAPERTGPRS